MFQRLGRFTTAHPWLVCAAWIAGAIALSLAAPAWNARAVDDDIHFLPSRCDSVRGYHRLAEAFPQDVFASRAVLAIERAERPLDPADFALIDRCVARLTRLRQEEPGLQIGQIASHRDAFIGKRLVSTDGHCSLIQVSLATPFLAVQTQATVDRAEAVVREELAEAGDAAPTLLVSGPAGIGRDLVRAGGSGLDGTTLATIILVIVVLLLVYRAPLLALVPLVTIGLSVWVALSGLALLTLIPGVYLVNVSKIFAIVLLYGAGTDYCLFLISRYREELAAGHETAAAMSQSVGHVGGALAASAGTVVWGLGLMAFAEFAKVRCAGPAIALALVVALLASLTLAPALLTLVGRAVFWPGSGPVQAEGSGENDFWGRISGLVVARPATVLVGSLALLAPLAVLGFELKPNYKPTGELSPQSQGVRGMEVIQNRFTAGETGPITVLLTSTLDWSSPEGRAVVHQLSRGFGYLDNVAEVRSLTQPLGTPMPELLNGPRKETKGALGALIKGLQKNIDQAEKAVREHYLAVLPASGPGSDRRYVTRLDVVLRSDPFALESAETLEVIQTWLRDELLLSSPSLAGLEWHCYGVTVNARDLARVTESDRARVNILVLSGIFLILMVLVRRLWLAAYLLVTVLLSYLATLGATSLMGLWWSGEPLTEVDWRVPFFLFTILVAVGEDYNILIVTRALEERKRHGTDKGLHLALARTGGTISSCGLIMAGTFATLMFAGLGTLVQTGFALAFGVLLDTFVVRPFLVPAFMLVIWRGNHPAAPPVETAPADEEPAPLRRAA
jgi:RND superfamily putative drug exporter